MPRYEYTGFEVVVMDPDTPVETRLAEWSQRLGPAGWQIVGSHLVQPTARTPYAPTTLIVLLQREASDA